VKGAAPGGTSANKNQPRERKGGRQGETKKSGASPSKGKEGGGALPSAKLDTSVLAEKTTRANSASLGKVCNGIRFTIGRGGHIRLVRGGTGEVKKM